MRPDVVRALLDRNEVPCDLSAALVALAPYSVLVTGAGTLGTAICRLLAGQVEELHCCDHSEVALYEMAREVPEASTHLCSVTMARQAGDLLSLTQAQVVIHTAAHKHVGLVEAMPRAGVKNNVGGLAALASSAKAAGVRRLLLISSDKAVSPVCVYGATKHVCERLAYGFRGQAGLEVTVLRLVNLLGSSGSVLPIFESRLQQRLPLVVSHPDVERHFVTVSEAARAAVQAAALSQAPLVTMPLFPPVRIADLAQRVMELHGRSETVLYTQLSPVEKLSERPLYQDEVTEPADDLLICRQPYPQPLLTTDSKFFGLKMAITDGCPADVRAALARLVSDDAEATT